MHNINLVKKSKKHIKGGADTVFERDLRDGILREFKSDNEDISNRNNINDIKLLFGSFNNSSINNCIFNYCNFVNVVFNGCQLNTVDFNNCTFQNIAFQMNSHLENVNFKNCSVVIDDEQGISISNSTINFADFRNMNFSYGIISNSHITDSDFRGVNLENTVFEDTDLTGIIFDERTNINDTQFINVTGLMNTDASDIDQASFDQAIFEPPLYTLDYSRDNDIHDNQYDDNLSEVSTIQTDIIDDPNDITMDQSLDLTNTFNDTNINETTINDRKNELLRRESINIHEYKYQTFNNLTKYDAVTMEELNYCDYIKEPNNIIFLYNEQTGFTNKDKLAELINTEPHVDKIVYQCKNLDNAYTPRITNIYENPLLNMDIFGIFGIMVPLQELDYVLNNNYQVYILQSNHYSKPIPIASLNSILGGNVVSANFCQANVNIKQGYINYIENEKFINICNKKGGKKNKTKKNKRMKNKTKKIKSQKVSKKNKTKKNKTKKNKTKK